MFVFRGLKTRARRMRRAGIATEGDSLAFCALRGEPHGGERPTWIAGLDRSEAGAEASPAKAQKRVVRSV
jgi:hypothetical protein